MLVLRQYTKRRLNTLAGASGRNRRLDHKRGHAGRSAQHRLAVIELSP
jgi:hypothetical protein